MVASARAGSALVGASAGRADEEAEGREGMITSRGYGKPLKSTLRILVIDDHHLFAEAIEATLARLASQVQVRTVATAEAALLELEKGKRFDLVLLDLGLPELRGRAAFEAITARADGAPVVLVTASEPNHEIRELMRHGARGFVHKRAKSEELLRVLRFVLEGGTHVPADLLAVPESAAEDAPLTPRQREVLVRLARGLSNKDIASELGIAEATVRVHVSSVMRVLDVENRTQAATSPQARRLVD